MTKRTRTAKSKKPNSKPKPAAAAAAETGSTIDTSTPQDQPTGNPWLDRVKEFRRVPAKDLKANPKNYREHSEEQRAALRGVLGKIGKADRILAVDTPDGLLMIDGHLRIEESAPDTMWPTLILDLTESEADELLAVSDPMSAMATTNYEKLADLFKTLEETESELAALVWPDYVVDPLKAASWERPQGADVSETLLTDREAAAERRVLFDASQWAIVCQGLDEWKAGGGPDDVAGFLVAAAAKWRPDETTNGNG